MEREHRITQRHIDYLQTLEKKGKLTAEQVLADAKLPESVLHDLYDWDPARAAEQFWLDRTRAIIRVVKIIVISEQHTFRLPKYVHDATVSGKTQGYVSIEAVRLDPALAQRTLIAELSRVTSALRRARVVAVALNLEGDVDDLLETVSGLQVVITPADDVDDDDEHADATAAPAS